MSGRSLLIMQARNNAWANGTLWSACAALSPSAYAASRPGFFGSLVRTMNHIYEVDLFYIDALVEGGEGRSVFDREDVAAASGLAALQSESDRRLIDFCEGLAERDLPATRIVARPDGPSVERVDRLLPHLFQHQVHHRGQAHAMLSHAGVDPPQLDDFFLDWGRVDSAKPYWDEVADA